MVLLDFLLQDNRCVTSCKFFQQFVSVSHHFILNESNHNTLKCTILVNSTEHWMNVVFHQLVANSSEKICNMHLKHSYTFNGIQEALRQIQGH